MRGETLPVDGLNRVSNAYMDMTKPQHPHHIPFNLYTEYGGADQTQEVNDRSSSLLTPQLSPSLAALSSSRTQETRHFIDAWPSEERERIGNRCSVPLNEKLPVSSLSLSMCGEYGTYGEESSEIAQMGRGEMNSQWRMMSPVSWLGSPPGGPLAEALCLGISGSTRAREPSSEQQY